MLWQLILIQVITFVVIIIFLRLLFYRHLSFALKRLQQLHQQNLDKETALNKELEAAKLNRQEEVEKGRQEAKLLVDKTKEEAEKRRQDILLKAKQDAEALLTEAGRETEALKHRVILEAEESSVNLALGLVREIFTQEARQELQRELVDELIVELRKIEKEKLKVETKKAEVISSYPLLDNQKNAIKEIIQGTLGYSIQLKEKTDPAIISGLIINLGGLVLDGSLSNKLRKAIPYLSKENDKTRTL